VTKNKPTQTHLNSLTDFRQQVYALFENERDVLFEIMDAIIQTPSARSYAELSLAPAFTRQWPSIYSALADGAVDTEGLRALCLKQAPRQQSRLHFALDVMAVRRMHSPTLKDRVFCHGAQARLAAKVSSSDCRIRSSLTSNSAARVGLPPFIRSGSNPISALWMSP
jgi:hypothetical protein